MGRGYAVNAVKDGVLRSATPQVGDRTAFHGVEWGSGRGASRKISTACGASNKGQDRPHAALCALTRRFASYGCSPP